MTRLLPIVLVFCFVSPSGAWAETVNETAIDERVREIAKHLRCTVCQTENIWESGAPLAHQMREVVRERVKLGHSSEDILIYFHSRYGDYIMMEPPKHGVNWIIWLAPLLLLLGGGTLLLREIKGWVTRTPPPQIETPPPLDEKSRRRIEEELQP